MSLKVVNLIKSYRDADRDLTIIQRLTYSFPEKGSIAIIGRSGIGKSTLLHLLGGLDRPTSGSVLYGDIDISSLPSDERAAFRAKHIGFIFQFHHLLPEFSALENVSIPLIISGVTEQEAKKESSALLDRLGLEHREQHLPSQLSGGEQQRVAIARALVTRPDIVSADEPTGNLDVATAAQVQEILLTMNKELKNLLVIVTHNRDLASSLDHVVEMLPGGELKRV